MRPCVHTHTHLRPALDVCHVILPFAMCRGVVLVSGCELLAALLHGLASRPAHARVCVGRLLGCRRVSKLPVLH